MAYLKRRKPNSMDFWFESFDPYIPHLTVYDDEDYVSTGLLDAEGNEIVRSDKQPMGFLSGVMED